MTMGLRWARRPQAPEAIIFNDLERPPNPDFKVTSLFDAEYLGNPTTVATEY